MTSEMALSGLFGAGPLPLLPTLKTPSDREQFFVLVIFVPDHLSDKSHRTIGLSTTSLQTARDRFDGATDGVMV
jgi:hypothetical protein